MAKQYKNVYTILEKVKKGEIKSHYKDRDGLFGKINFYKKPDLIKPYLHYMDENRLDSMMSEFIKDKSNSTKMIYSKLTPEFKKLSGDRKPDLDDFHLKMIENYRRFPKHILRDIFKMYYHRIETLDFEDRNDSNLSKYKFLEKANNPIGKIMSESSNLKSAIYARNILSYLIGRITTLEYLDSDAAKSIQNSMESNSEFDNADLEKALDKMMETDTAKKGLEEVMQKAQDLCKEIDQNLSTDVQEQLFDAANSPSNNNTAGKLSTDFIRTVAQELQKVKLSLGSLKEKIKKLLDKSVNYFGSQKEPIFEDLLNSDNVSELDEYHLLNPKIRKIFLEDITIKDVKFVGKIDLYIDISGSMSSDCGVKNLDGKSISKIDFCKSFAAKLEELNMLNEVYLFDNRVKKYRKDPVSIALLDCGGGTTINAAVRSIEQNGVNALVITDAEDHCTEYSDKAFFIGVEGARFAHFNKLALKNYVDKGQIVVFNGERIFNVDINGNLIK